MSATVAAIALPPVDASSLGKVAVLLGGTSAEREVSLTMSGPGVLAALRSAGVDAHPFDPAVQPLQRLADDRFDRVFIALHGRHGEDGTVQGALELLGLPYTGSGVMASAIAMDKTMTKRLWRADGLPTPDWRWLSADDATPRAMREVADALGLPLMVKAPREGSTLGISRVDDVAKLPAALQHASRYDRDVLCEQFVDGEEVTCPVLGEGAQAFALPVVRIRAPEGNYDFANKYFGDAVRYDCPSGLPDAEEAGLRRLAVAAYRSLGCRGWGRADFMIRRGDRQPLLLEMNTSPGMTSHSLVPISARAAGISYERLCLHLLAQATLDAGPLPRRGAAG